jgi:hypothetical protein
MRNYLDFEKEIKTLEEDLENSKIHLIKKEFQK